MAVQHLAEGGVARELAGELRKGHLRAALWSGAELSLQLADNLVLDGGLAPCQPLDGGGGRHLSERLLELDGEHDAQRDHGLDGNVRNRVGRCAAASAAHHHHLRHHHATAAAATAAATSFRDGHADRRAVRRAARVQKSLGLRDRAEARRRLHGHTVQQDRVRAARPQLVVIREVGLRLRGREAARHLALEHLVDVAAAHLAQRVVARELASQLGQRHLRAALRSAAELRLELADHLVLDGGLAPCHRLDGGGLGDLVHALLELDGQHDAQCVQRRRRFLRHGGAAATTCRRRCRSRSRSRCRCGSRSRGWSGGRSRRRSDGLGRRRCCGSRSRLSSRCSRCSRLLSSGLGRRLLLNHSRAVRTNVWQLQHNVTTSPFVSAFPVFVPSLSW